MEGSLFGVGIRLLPNVGDGLGAFVRTVLRRTLLANHF